MTPRVEVLNRATGYAVRQRRVADGSMRSVSRWAGLTRVTVRATRVSRPRVGQHLHRLGHPASSMLVLASAVQTLDRRARGGARPIGLDRTGLARSQRSPIRCCTGCRRSTETCTTSCDSCRRSARALDGLSGGASFRLNSYLIDGVSDRQLGSNSVMGGARGGKSMPIDALKEYQVLLSPYDARYGDFAGLLVNAVTKSGTNELRGSVFGISATSSSRGARTFCAARRTSAANIGFTLGGPIVRDRVHFFIAPGVSAHA